MYNLGVPEPKFEFFEKLISLGYNRPIDMIERTMSSNDLLLGQGSSADVYSIPNIDGLAFRVVRDFSRFPLGWSDFEYCDNFPDNNYGQQIFKTEFFQFVRRQDGETIRSLFSKKGSLLHDWIDFLSGVPDQAYRKLFEDIHTIEDMGYYWLGADDDLLFDGSSFNLVDLTRIHMRLDSMKEDLLHMMIALIPQGTKNVPPNSRLSYKGLHLFDRLSDLSEGSLHFPQQTKMNDNLITYFIQFIPYSFRKAYRAQ